MFLQRAEQVFDFFFLLLLFFQRGLFLVLAAEVDVTAINRHQFFATELVESHGHPFVDRIGHQNDLVAAALEGLEQR